MAGWFEDIPCLTFVLVILCVAVYWLLLLNTDACNRWGVLCGGLMVVLAIGLVLCSCWVGPGD